MSSQLGASRWLLLAGYFGKDTVSWEIKVLATSRHRAAARVKTWPSQQIMNYARRFQFVGVAGVCIGSIHLASELAEFRVHIKRWFTAGRPSAHTKHWGWDM